VARCAAAAVTPTDTASPTTQIAQKRKVKNIIDRFLGSLHAGGEIPEEYSDARDKMNVYKVYDYVLLLSGILLGMAVIVQGYEDDYGLLYISFGLTLIVVSSYIFYLNQVSKFSDLSTVLTEVKRTVSAREH
jgi:hypothetical protein